ncbi:hypothetical protein RFI_10937 [Reticulomyxa filosa]|uniref:Uncharacterized protein n=1 Tax=Reticulomyxa filosa TaxID=46433 RepID=X6NKD3_RETFI|nr:hypothetical protein RFI_10937 [Reticulomyxa filosa]|eukprot:ETO26199.1 hypothetical protein RFI_10937 [Reticulomyxa filosa]
MPHPTLCSHWYGSELDQGTPQTKSARAVDGPVEMEDTPPVDDSDCAANGKAVIGTCETADNVMTMESNVQSIEDIMFKGQLLCPICLKTLKIEDSGLQQQYETYLRSKQIECDTSNEWMDYRFTDEPIMYGIQKSMLKFHVATHHPDFVVKSFKNNHSIHRRSNTAHNGHSNGNSNAAWKKNESEIDEEAVKMYCSGDHHHDDKGIDDKSSHPNVLDDLIGPCSGDSGKLKAVPTTATSSSNTNTCPLPTSSSSSLQFKTFRHFFFFFFFSKKNYTLLIVDTITCTYTYTNISRPNNRLTNHKTKNEFLYNRTDRSNLIDFVTKTVERFHSNQVNTIIALFDFFFKVLLQETYESILHDLPNDPQMLLELIKFSFVILDTNKKYCESVDRIVTEKMIDMTALDEENKLLKQMMKEHLSEMKPQLEQRLRDSRPYQLYKQRYKADYLTKLQEQTTEEERQLLNNIGTYYQELYKKEANIIGKHSQSYKPVEESSSQPTKIIHYKNNNNNSNAFGTTHTITIRNIPNGLHITKPSFRSFQSNVIAMDTNLSQTGAPGMHATSIANINAPAASNHCVPPLKPTTIITHNAPTVLSNSCFATFVDFDFVMLKKKKKFTKHAYKKRWHPNATNTKN